VLQDELELLAEKALPPDSLEANVEIFFFTWLLPQVGQFTSTGLRVVKTSFSKGSPQSVHWYSKMGMRDSYTE
jgi:hypothetical protein